MALPWEPPEFLKKDPLEQLSKTTVEASKT